MLSKITWGEFLTGLAILAFLYYLAIGVKYRTQFKALWNSKINKKREEPERIDSEGAETYKGSVQELEDVTRDLKYAVFDKSNKHTAKSTLLRNLQKRLNHYEGIHKQSHQYAINNYIIGQAEEICGLQFSEAELKAAWEELPSDNF